MTKEWIKSYITQEVLGKDNYRLEIYLRLRYFKILMVNGNVIN